MKQTIPKVKYASEFKVTNPEDNHPVITKEELDKAMKQLFYNI